MKRAIAIIDADICFTYLLVSRLQKHLPDVMAFPVSAKALRSHRTLILDNDFVLYNQHEISENEILRHCVKEHLPILIPLLSTKAPYPPKDVLMLIHEVESRAGLGRIPLPKGSTVQTCLALSFISPEEREAHVRKLMERSRNDFRHIIRLDLMPGIRMAADPPSWNQEGILRPAGSLLFFPNLDTARSICGTSPPIWNRIHTEIFVSDGRFIRTMSSMRMPEPYFGL